MPRAEKSMLLIVANPMPKESMRALECYGKHRDFAEAGGYECHLRAADDYLEDGSVPRLIVLDGNHRARTFDGADMIERFFEEEHAIA